MMKKLIIIGFKSKTQYRIDFVNFLKKAGDMGLANAKGLQDDMLDGKPIVLSVLENNIDSYKDTLDNLEMAYEIK